MIFYYTVHTRAKRLICICGTQMMCDYMFGLCIINLIILLVAR